MQLRLHSIISKTDVLGPYTRFSLWVQGCHLRCPGCIAPETWAENGGFTISVDEVAARITETPNIEGLTITGGEPFLQPAPLAELIYSVRKDRPLGVIVYTGFSLVELRKKSMTDQDCATFLSKIDLLVDGYYIERENYGQSLRGSANQQVHALTKRYNQHLNFYEQRQRPVEIHLRNKDIFMVGIPGKETLKKWQARFGLLN